MGFKRRRYLTVVEEVSFSSDLRELQKKYPRIEEVKAAIDWNLARAPEIFQSVEDFRNCFVLETKGFCSDIYLFRVLYKYNRKKDPNRIFLLAISEVESGE